MQLIVCTDINGGIGKNGTIPWKFPEDMKLFRQKTVNSVVVMGRRTWDSVQKEFRPLSNRENVVITSRSIDDEGVRTFPSCEECLGWLISKREKRIFIIGGKSVYDWFFRKGLIDRVCLTTIYNDYECDTRLDYDRGFFLDSEEWELQTTDWLDFITAENRSRVNHSVSVGRARYDEFVKK